MLKVSFICQNLEDEDMRKTASLTLCLQSPAKPDLRFVPGPSACSEGGQKGGGLSGRRQHLARSTVTKPGEISCPLGHHKKDGLVSLLSVLPDRMEAKCCKMSVE